ncbi:MAG TPA: ion transporter, partial [Xanthomarina gelatinilytica]|nr:ion transporter [Xanthomarina gelatinilytica]
QSKQKEEPRKNNMVHVNTQCCVNCLNEKHQDGAEFCYKCGCKLHHD